MSRTLHLALEQEKREVRMDGALSAALVEFRRRWALNKTDLIRLLQAHGLPATTFATYNGWEAGVEPKPVYQVALAEALKRIERKLRRERGAPAEPARTGDLREPAPAQHEGVQR